MRRALAAAALLALLVSRRAPARATTAEPGRHARRASCSAAPSRSRGEAAAFGAVGPGAKAYFDYVNAQGGVNGRKIDYLFYDDGYDPARPSS